MNQGLEKLRAASGTRTTTGLTDQRLQAFAEDPLLNQAIDEAVAARDNLDHQVSELIKGDESELLSALQHGYVSFYDPVTTNPYVPLAARGPWIITTHGGVVHDSGGYGMLGHGHAPQNILDVLAQPFVMANVMTVSISQKRFFEALLTEVGSNRSDGCPFVAFQCLNSGSESVSLACRISDINAKVMTDPGGPAEGQRPLFVVLEGGFHGRTGRPALMSDSTRSLYSKHLASHRNRDDIVAVPANDIEALRATFKMAEETKRFIEMVALEPVQGEGNPGNPLDRAFYDVARELTSEHGAMLLVDSIQAGFRGTGYLSIVDYPGFEDCQAPDMETWSKALNAGQFPLSVLGLNGRAAEAFRIGIYGNTMTTNPRALEVGRAVLTAVTPQMRQNVQERGKEFVAALAELQGKHPTKITHVQGTGLLTAAFVIPEIPVVGADGLEIRCRKLGLGVIHGGDNALRFTPHFNLTSDEVHMMVDVLDQVFNEV